jgi:hypothetical protein
MIITFVTSITSILTSNPMFFSVVEVLVSQPHFEGVRMTLTLLKWGLGNPSGLPKT